MKILLATLHAKYIHASLALPYLAAACAGLDGATTAIREFTVNEPPDRILRSIVAEQADLVAFSCYIWNTGETLRLAADLKKLLPRTFVVLGGPEASHGFFELLERNPAIDCIIRGEGEETFRELAAAFSASGPATHSEQVANGIAGLACRAGDEIVATPERAPISDLDAVPSPFAAGLADLTKPLVYYETSRGCPFSCAFCMSSLEKGVRSFSPARIETDLECLMAAGVQTVKLVDRTFNYDAERADAIWRFILERNRSSRFHFEIAADLLTGKNLRLLAEVPAGMFRFEIGVQSGEEETLARVARRSDLDRLFANVRRLVAETGVTVHLDLVAGLPGEDFEGFLRSLQRIFDVLSFDNSYFFDCQGGKEEATEAYREVRRGASDAANAGRREKTDCHIQVEPLKVLKGSPMRRIAREEGYLYSDTPPYKILRTPWLSFEDISRIETVARLLDLYYNSGRFAATLRTVAETVPLSRLFAALAAFRERRGEEAGMSLAALFDEFWEFAEGFTEGIGLERVRTALCYDYCLTGYPAGRLPSFFPESGGGEIARRKEQLAALTRRLGIGKESRVRTFGRHFARDPRRPPGEEREADLLFVYISTPGRGLEVRVLEGDAP
ncbi:MAG TPA: DUF4080 domain-containing protein [Geobacteraceae bacterium]